MIHLVDVLGGLLTGGAFGFLRNLLDMFLERGRNNRSAASDGFTVAMIDSQTRLVVAETELTKVRAEADVNLRLADVPDADLLPTTTGRDVNSLVRMMFAVVAAITFLLATLTAFGIVTSSGQQNDGGLMLSFATNTCSTVIAYYFMTRHFGGPKSL